MTYEEAREYMRTEIEKLLDKYGDRRYNFLQGEAVGMVKTFKKVGIIPQNDQEALDELLEMI